MANYTILHDLVQGLPQTGTNAKTSNPLNAVTVTNTQVGGVYYTKGQVVAQALISASQPRLDAMVALGAIV